MEVGRDGNGNVPKSKDLLYQNPIMYRIPVPFMLNKKDIFSLKSYSYDYVPLPLLSRYRFGSYVTYRYRSCN